MGRESEGADGAPGVTADDLRQMASEGRRVIVAVRWDSRANDSFPFFEMPVETLEVFADMAEELAYRGGSAELLRRLDDLAVERWR